MKFLLATVAVILYASKIVTSFPRLRRFCVMRGQVFVCTNKWCREKGSDATMATFSFLTPPNVPVVGVNCLSRCNKGPNCRILNSDGAFIEASMVRSVESVVELLQSHLGLKVNITSAEVLRLNYEGNVYLRSGEVDQAIECYDKALELGDQEQEGVLLVMRGTALLQRAYVYRMRHKDVMTLAEGTLPTSDGMRSYADAFSGLSPPARYRATMDMISKVGSVLSNLEVSQKWGEARTRWQEGMEGPVVATGADLLGRASFCWAMYEHTLMRALSDLLSATVVMPGFAQAWRRAGDALGELRQFNSAIEYYEVAIRLDAGMKDVLLPSIERMKLMEKLMENASAKGWAADAILELLED